jgi:hypothetical protein
VAGMRGCGGARARGCVRRAFSVLLVAGVPVVMLVVHAG